MQGHGINLGMLEHEKREMGGKESGAKGKRKASARRRHWLRKTALT